jgi:hypothetical protein
MNHVELWDDGIELERITADDEHLRAQARALARNDRDVDGVREPRDVLLQVPARRRRADAPHDDNRSKRRQSMLRERLANARASSLSSHFRVCNGTECVRSFYAMPN